MQIIDTLGSIVNLILQPFVWVSINILMACYLVFELLHFPAPLAFAIIGLTVIVRLITYPLFARQIKFSKKTQELAPEVAKLRELHKGDNRKFIAEQSRLYKEHGISQQVGCLVTIVQLPVLLALYNVLNGIFFVHGKVASAAQQIHYINSNVIPPLQISAPLDTQIWALSLADKPSTLLSQGNALILLVPLVTGVLSFIQTKMLSPNPVKIHKDDSTREIKEKQQVGDMTTQMQSQMLILAPLMIGFFSYTLPLGISLYWNTSTIFGIIQQYKISGWGGMESIWQRARIRK